MASSINLVVDVILVDYTNFAKRIPHKKGNVTLFNIKKHQSDNHTTFIPLSNLWDCPFKWRNKKKIDLQVLYAQNLLRLMLIFGKYNRHMYTEY